MICLGRQDEVHWPDNWTAVTVRFHPSRIHFELTKGNDRPMENAPPNLKRRFS